MEIENGIFSLRNGSHLAAVTPTNYVLELSPDAAGSPRKQPESKQADSRLKRKRRSAKQQHQAAAAALTLASTSQGTLNL